MTARALAAAAFLAAAALPFFLPLAGANHVEQRDGAAYVGVSNAALAFHLAASTKPLPDNIDTCRSSPSSCHGPTTIPRGACVTAYAKAQRTTDTTWAPTTIRLYLVPHTHPTAHGSDGNANWLGGYAIHEFTADDFPTTPIPLPWSAEVRICATSADGAAADGPFRLVAWAERLTSSCSPDCNTYDGRINTDDRGLLPAGYLWASTHYSARLTGGGTAAAVEDPIRLTVPAAIYAGQTATVTVTRMNLTGAGLAGLAAQTFLTVHRPDGTRLLTETTPADVGHGSYVLNFTAPAAGPLGCKWWIKLRDGTSSATPAAAPFCVVADPVAYLRDMDARMNASLAREATLRHLGSGTWATANGTNANVLGHDALDRERHGLLRDDAERHAATTATNHVAATTKLNALDAALAGTTERPALAALAGAAVVAFAVFLTRSRKTP